MAAFICGMDIDDDTSGTWLPLAQAAPKLGLSLDGLRQRVRRGQAQTRKGNDGRVLVLVPDQAMDAPTNAVTGTVSDDVSAADARQMHDAAMAELRGERDELRQVVETWRGKAETSALEAARAVAERDARDVLIGELRAELAHHRRPWWARMLGRAG